MTKETEEGLQSLDKLVDQAIQFADGMVDNKSAQAGIVVELVRAGARALANAGVISQGEASDEFAIAQLVQKKLGVGGDEAEAHPEDPGLAKSFAQKQKEVEEAARKSRDEKWDKFEDMKVSDLPKWIRPGIVGNATEQKDDPNVTRLYDKFAAPPRTTPPPPLEENRGDVYMPPPPDIPLEFQVPPTPKDRVFTPPDPLMRSEDTTLTANPTRRGPTTNIGYDSDGVEPDQSERLSPEVAEQNQAAIPASKIDQGQGQQIGEERKGPLNQPRQPSGPFGPTSSQTNPNPNPQAGQSGKPAPEGQEFHGELRGDVSGRFKRK